MANTSRIRQAARTAGSSTVHTIKVTLAGSTPPIWRRLEVPSAITLATLHQVIQAAFGWEDYHLWVFETLSGRYGIADPELDMRAATTKRLDQIAPDPRDKFGYLYDFGDNWEHNVLVEAVTAAEPGIVYPRCLTGRRACPPEDCGGIWGYDNLLEILADPTHEEHTERLEWLGLETPDQFDPAAFDRADVNTALSRLTTILLKN